MNRLFNIKNLLRKALLNEDKKATYEKGCVMLYFDIDKTYKKNILDQIKKEDLYVGSKGDKDKYGIEDEDHITILYGILPDVPDNDVEEICNQFKIPKLKFTGISSFDNDDYDVLKFDIDSDDLIRYNKMLKKLPYENDYPVYHAHSTICYLLKGKAKEYIELFKDIEEPTVDNFSIKYSKPDGTKKTYNIKQ